MKIKVSDLKDEKLAEWTARAQGWEVREPDEETKAHQLYDYGEWFPFYVDKNGKEICEVDDYKPYINGGQAMELAEKFGLIINFEIGEVWKNGESFKLGNRGDYSAICRAVVASVYGEEIDDES